MLEKNDCAFRRFENMVPLTVNIKFQNGFTYLNSPIKKAGKVAGIPKTCNYMAVLILPEYSPGPNPKNIPLWAKMN